MMVSKAGEKQTTIYQHLQNLKSPDTQRAALHLVLSCVLSIRIRSGSGKCAQNHK